jgi:hypothetical protein
MAESNIDTKKTPGPGRQLLYMGLVFLAIVVVSACIDLILGT